MFKDRQDAGRRLAAALLKYRGQDVVVVGLPRGGIPVALEIARALAAPMTMIFVRKIGVPARPEVAMGAVVDGANSYVVRNSDIIRLTGVSESVFQSAMDAELKEIARRKSLFKGILPSIDIAGKIVILVDDGIATGATMKAAAIAIEQCGVERIVIAVPAAPSEVVADLENDAEEIVYLESASPFGAVGSFYLNFPQLSDGDVIDCFQQLTASAS
ncbi:phosphoribosyltransferase [Rhizobium binae]|uniref:Phosphoribosyltransferase n=1 Tax=Rhizobium binae TaxID=1138190 RepID=A0ABV2MHG1_9HYPH|nr:phosphoribosyltransferase family protein [Rhizobium binae]NKL48541.1 phosphoribosyltransferase [Rhizobium leguminosarum bv. viciae]MBX4938446.1 phosphoribosyltransferase [Rhizobium binae]MBX4944953.1 phosphoribosyltransferase [Rhizobium binae]MBX4952134.1 phosphoribosyltransferase [Rhizobium binae]MBX4961494.1 phosphoribosyltransferase [Rhizobium binae]